MKKLISLFLLFLSVFPVSAVTIKYSGDKEDSIITEVTLPEQKGEDGVIYVSPKAISRQGRGLPTEVHAAVTVRCAYYYAFVCSFPKLVAAVGPECTQGLVLIMEKEEKPNIESCLSYSPQESACIRRADSLVFGNGAHDFHTVVYMESELVRGSTLPAEELAVTARRECSVLAQKAAAHAAAAAALFRCLESVRDTATAKKAAEMLDIEACITATTAYKEEREHFNATHKVNAPGISGMPSLISFELRRLTNECNRITGQAFYGSAALKKRLLSITDRLLSAQ